MAPVLRYTRAQPRVLVAAPSAVRGADVAAAPPCGCLGPRPAPPAPPRRVPLSALDTFLFVRLLQIPVAFFYRTRVDPNTLAASLARTLERFPVVAGVQLLSQRVHLMCRAKCSACCGPDFHHPSLPASSLAGRLRPAAHGAEAAAGAAGPAVNGDYDVLCNNEGVYFDM